MNRLYWKIFGFLLIAQLLIIAVISTGFWLNHQNRLHNTQGISTSFPARAMIQSASAALKYGGQEALKSLLTDWQSQRMPVLLAIDSNGNELLQRDYSAESLATANTLINKNEVVSVQAVTLANGEAITLFVPNDDFCFRKPPTSIKHQSASSHHSPCAGRYKPKRFPTLPILASILASFLSAALIAWYFSKPIQLLQAAFSKGAKGDLISDVAQKMGTRKDAFSDLGHDFDSMASRLSKLLKGQKHLLNHVSHELRSPLSRIQIAIGLAKQNSAKTPAALDRIQLESERMDQLIGELLQLSKLESGVNTLNKTNVNLSHLLQDMLDDAKFEASEKNITVVSDIQPNCQLNCEAELLYHAIENIVRNALKFSPANSKVSVAMHQTQQSLEIKVSDQGDGVAESALEDIFEPFVRSNDAQDQHGYGIGLALAKQVIHAHQGTIKAKNNPHGSGLTVMIVLPI